jgi:hypothetical protein
MQFTGQIISPKGANVGDAKRRKAAIQGHFPKLDKELQELGIDTTQFGFYDQPAFLAREQLDNEFLEKYGEWVVRRPFDEAYAAHVSNVVPRLIRLVHSEFVAHGLEGGCVAASGMITRMLDRLGVWSVAVSGSLTLDVDNGRIRRMLHSVDKRDFEGAALGHAWVIAPPYVVADAVISLQHWKNDEMEKYIPNYVLATSAETRVIRPTVGDVVSNEIRAINLQSGGYKDSELHYHLEPRLRSFGLNFPAHEIQIGKLRLRYVPVAIRQTDVPLEDINTQSGRGRPAIEFWNEKIIPEFGLK